jgi:hypothetical protein
MHLIGKHFSPNKPILSRAYQVAELQESQQAKNSGTAIAISDVAAKSRQGSWAIATSPSVPPKP